MYAPLMEFIRAAASDTDFFCLQEVFDSPESHALDWGGRADIYKDLRAALPDFTPFFDVAVENFDGDLTVDFPLSHGNAIFAKKDIAILSHGGFFLAGEDWQGPGTSQISPHKLQYVRFEKHGTAYALANVHGIAYPGAKTDTPERIAQSQKIIDFLADETGEKILGGDFNLLPDTESIRMIERAGMRDLITDFGISATRNQLSYGRYPEAERQYFADFAFVSPAIRVTEFQVPPMEISDHLPLVLTCEL